MQPTIIKIPVTVVASEETWLMLGLIIESDEELINEALRNAMDLANAPLPVAFMQNVDESGVHAMTWRSQTPPNGTAVEIEVEFEPFWMSSYEVTWAEYKQYMALYQSFKKLAAAKQQQATDESKHLIVTAPWVAITPGVALIATVLACTLLGDSLRDRLAGEKPQDLAERA